MLRKYGPWILVAVAALVLAGIVGWRFGPFNRPATAEAGAAIGGQFHLVDQNGAPVDEKVLKGKWTAIFFGYTFCPDVCPTTLQTLGAASQTLGAHGKDFQVVFVTVDPQRDTPPVLKAYLSSAAFPRGAIGLTGTPDQVAAVTKSYGVFYEKAGDGKDYAVNHSSAIYLMNPQGRFDSVIAYGLTPDETREQILKAMRKAGQA